MENHHIILKISFGWEIPDLGFEKFNHSFELNKLYEKYRYHFEDLSNSVLQIFEDPQALDTAYQNRDEILEKTHVHNIPPPILDQIGNDLIELGWMPPKFPQEGLHFILEVINWNHPQEKWFDEYLYYREIDPEIQVESLIPHEKFRISFSSKEVYIRFMVVLRSDVFKDK